MGIWEHSRWRIFNQQQHPYKHSLTDFIFSSPRLPGVSNLEDTLNYLIAVIYPNYIGTYATPGDLPGTSSANDYAIVSDDGDGKSAGYVWSVIDGAGVWHKRYDVDWSMESILAETINRTQYMYVQKYGMQDRDDAGAYLTGINAGQHVYGSDVASGNLTLHANSGDSAGVRTGYVQSDDNFRPTVTATLDLGTTALKWATLYVGDIRTATMTTTGTITVGGAVTATGAVTGSNLSGTNTGDLTLAAIGATPNANGMTLTGQALNLEPASASFGGIVTTGAQTFAGAKTFSGAASFTGASTGLAVTNDATIGGTLVVTGTIGGLNLSGTNTGDVTIGAFGSAPDAKGITISSQVITLQPADATHPGAITTGAQSIAGAKTWTGAAVFSSAGTALSVTNDASIGGTTTFGGNLITGATTFVIAELFALRNVAFRDATRLSAVQNGDALFYDSASGTWLASAPDSEITHSSLTGLTTGDAGHTQFALLAGRSGGQALVGGTAASENLTLESTSNGSKGYILVKDVLAPNTTASYSGGWAGTDLGDATHYFRDIYSRGVHKGLRLENYTSSTLPSASAQNPGRLVWSTDDKHVYSDTGGSWRAISVQRSITDTSWNGSDVTKDVNVSADISDARNAIWALHDNANDYDRIYCSIKAISASTVRLTVSIPLPSGTYRLIGLA